jgi:hypothetical protein
MIETPKELITAYQVYHDYLKTRIYEPDRVQRANILNRLQQIKKRTAAEDALLKELEASLGESTALNLDAEKLCLDILGHYKKCLVGKTFVLKDNPWDNYVLIQEVGKEGDSLGLSGKLVGTDSAYTVPEITPWSVEIKGGFIELSKRVANEKITEIPFFAELTEISTEEVIAKMQAMCMEYKTLNDAAVAKFCEILGATNV